MIKTLIKKQLLELFQNLYVDQKTGKAKSKGKIALSFGGYVLLFVIMAAVFYLMAWNMGSKILNTGKNWLYFSLMSLAAIALGLFGSVFSTYSTLYLPQDNEMLLSLPIPTGNLIIARVSGVYITSLLFSAMVWLPTCLCYWGSVTVNVLNVVFPLLLTFIIALLVTVLSCALGFVVAVISTKAKGKSILSALAGFVGLGLYYVFYFKISKQIEEITQHLDEISDFAQKFRFVYWLSNGADGDVPSMLLATGITLALAALCYFILSKTLLKIVITKGTTAKKPVREEKATLRSPKDALLSRELKHFSSESVWMLNGAVGLVLMVLLSVTLIVLGKNVRELYTMIAESTPMLAKAMPALLVTVTCFIISANILTPCALSMEGKTLWQLQTLPIPPADALLAKSRMGTVLTIGPSLLFVLVSGIVLEMGFAELFLALLAVTAFVLMFSCYGLKLNVKRPNFIWTDANTVCKQSTPVFLSMLGSWGLCLVLGIIGFALSNLLGNSIVALIVYAVICALLWLKNRRWIQTKGAAIFASL